MNEKQDRLYWREWNKARRILRETMSPSVADAERHALHIRALGGDKSSTLLTNSDFDKILAEFRAISQPANATTQIELEQMPGTRARHYIAQLLAALDKNESYAEAIITRMQRGRKQRSTGAGRMVTLETLPAADLEKLKIALKKECRRRWKTKSDLLDEIRVLRMSHDIGGETTVAAIHKALNWHPALPMPQVEILDYEQLLSVVAAFRHMLEEPF